MKTFTEFQEGVAALALKGGIKFLPKIPSALKAVTAGTLSGLSLLQARKYKTRKNPTARTSKRKLGNMEKAYNKREEGDRSNDMIVAKPGEAQKQNKLIDKYEKIEKSTENNLKRRNFIKRLKGDIPEEAMAAPTNSTGSAVPGTGDDSSTVVVNKKKRYIYGGKGSRKMWMNNK